MSGINLNSNAGMKLMELSQSSYRPKEIVELKQKIESETRAAEVNASITGTIDNERIRAIVSMKFELDSLYCRWAEGEIS